MVIGIDLYNDWKFIQCPTCCHKVDWANVHYYCKECKKNVINSRQTYTPTKYYGDIVDVVKEKFGIILPSKVNSVNSKITDKDERMMDEIQWGSISGSTTSIPKTAIEVPLSTVHEVRAPNMEPSKDGFENVDVKEVVMDEEDMKELYVKKDNMKQVDVKEVVMDEEDTKESYVKKVNMKEVDVKEVVIDEEYTKEAYVKKMI
uniref:Uncharacterized protein n=1 Tax=Tanacetum cinerariifolium TaxID=118510 RepID=A0A6L2J722_TANCI|nr:hypothetical protein [Tanacetum cinerariifolium]